LPRRKKKKQMQEKEAPLSPLKKKGAELKAFDRLGKGGNIEVEESKNAFGLSEKSVTRLMNSASKNVERAAIRGSLGENSRQEKTDA